MNKRATDPPGDQQSSHTKPPESDGAIDRRKLLKAAGLGMAATAGAIAAASPAGAQIIDEQIIPQLAPDEVVVPVPTQNLAVTCGTVSTTRLKGDTIEITVPEGRQVLVRQVPAAAQPLGEVIVNISRSIVETSNKPLLIPEIIPG